MAITIDVDQGNALYDLLAACGRFLNGLPRIETEE
jgi:hypothetical protein